MGLEVSPDHSLPDSGNLVRQDYQIGVDTSDDDNGSFRGQYDSPRLY
jgi:hypothetical protein